MTIDSQSPFYRTGDLGYLDMNSILFITGRMEERILKGDSQICPLEIDAILMSHEAVQEACTIGVPSELWKEDLEVCVVLNELFTGIEGIGNTQLLEWCTKKLPKEKVPRQIWIVNHLPKDSLGRLKRVELTASMSVNDSTSLPSKL